MAWTCFQKIISGCAVWCMAAVACAQYVWLDEKGVKQYSDMPPGPSVPASRILKQPNGSAQPAPGSSAAPEKEEKSATAAKPAPTLAERNAEFLKRRQEQAEKDKKAEEEAKRKADMQANCDRARASNRAIDSGQRMYTIAPDGSRHYLTDGERAQQRADNNKAIEGCGN